MMRIKSCYNLFDVFSMKGPLWAMYCLADYAYTAITIIKLERIAI